MSAARIVRRRHRRNGRERPRARVVIDAERVAQLEARRAAFYAEHGTDDEGERRRGAV